MRTTEAVQKLVGMGWEDSWKDFMVPSFDAKLKLKGERFFYNINLRDADGKDSGYIGASFSNKEPLEGESWLRGGDLADGPMGDDTLSRVIADLEAMEKHGMKAAFVGEA